MTNYYNLFTNNVNIINNKIDTNNNNNNNDNINFEDNNYWKHKNIDPHTAIIKIPFEKVQQQENNNGNNNIYQYKLEINFNDEDSLEINIVNVLIAFIL